MTYEKIEVQPLAGALGAEIAGVDLSADLGNQTFDEIHTAFLEHQVIVFREQKLTPEQQLAFGRRFGPPNIYPFVDGLPETPEIIEILKSEQDKKNFGGAWHSDTTYLGRPPLGTMLYAKETPTVGGDTQFANTYLAYEVLSDGMKAVLEGLVGINSAALKGAGGRAKTSGGNPDMKAANLEQSDELQASHPIVRTHPETGRKSLYLNRAHTVCFEGMAEEESRPLIDYLCHHITRPEFTCRVRWAVDTLTFWDNRCVQHYAINDYPGQRRRMHRLTIEGDRPS